MTTAVTVQQQVITAVTPFMEKMMDQYPQFTDSTPISEFAQALTTLAPVSELNTIVRIINPEAKLSGKGITALSKATEIMNYVFNAHQEMEAQEEMKAEEAAYEEQKEQQRRIEATVKFINQRAGAEIVSIHTPAEVLKNIALTYKNTPVHPTFTQDQLDQAVQSGFQAGVEEAVSQVETAPTQQPTVDVVAVYDALQTKGKDLLKQATDAAKAGNMSLSNTLMQQYQEVMEKVGTLRMKHKDSIFSAERSKKILDNARQSLADGLRNTADVTDKYGHIGVDGLMNLANQVLNGVVQVAQTTINVTGQVGHATVNLASGTLNATAELVEPKKN